MGLIVPVAFTLQPGSPLAAVPGSPPRGYREQRILRRVCPSAGSQESDKAEQLDSRERLEQSPAEGCRAVREESIRRLGLTYTHYCMYGVGMATDSGILACRIPWTEEPGGLQFTGLPRVRHGWATEHALLLLLLSRVQLCATPQTTAHQPPLSLGFSRQEHWSGLPCPSPMHESEKRK